MNPFKPKFTITNRMTAAITCIERARGFLEAAQLSADWVREMGNRALVLEAHHTTHIEGTRLTLDQAERLWKGEAVPEADPDDVRELLNYRAAFEFVSDCRMPVEMIIDHWNPSKKRYRFETFCYGPKKCAFYKVVPKRKVPGRKGMSYTEEDWVDEDATSHRDRMIEDQVEPTIDILSV